MEIEGQKLWDMLEAAGLLNTPISAMNREQIERVAEAFDACVHGTTPPYWKNYSDGTRCLCIPHTAAKADKPHLHKNNIDVLRRVLTDLNATKEELAMYGFKEEK